MHKMIIRNDVQRTLKGYSNFAVSMRLVSTR